MNREQKTATTNDLAGVVKDAPLVVLADFRGVTVGEINQFRRALAEQGLHYQVVKNTLGRRAVAGTPKENLAPYLTGMTGWIISGDDPIAAAKLLREATKDFKKRQVLTIKGGWFDGQALNESEVQKVADLPSREELLSILLRTVQENPRLLLGALQAPARDLLYLLKNFEKKQEEGN